jgi:hypothetical protein
MTYYGYMQGGLGKDTPFGGEQIPLLPTIYRKTAIWGAEGSRDQTLADKLLNMLFFNIVGGVGFRPEDLFTEITDSYYLHMVPWFKLHNKDVESYRRIGSEVFIGLEGNSKISMDLTAKTYSVDLGGVEIARDQSTFCQLDDDRIAFYSINPGYLSAPLPQDWNAAEMGAWTLSTGHAEEIEPEVSTKDVKVFVPSRRPVIVYRNGAKQKQIRSNLQT